ncbi:MAG: hypothetical protein QOG99_2930 [Frankiales bacterium]|jgi:glycosyltransferase involved in cell wall biosynthesis|nr:hypothetical protein [Frankiales bacterium]
MNDVVDEPLVSIVVDNYDYAQFLGEAVRSALDQSYGRTEVIVVDDGSRDGSRKVIRSFGDRIAPILKENGGQGSAFNAGFAASSGDLVLFLDSDDFLYAGAIEAAVAAFREGVAKVHFRLTVVDGHGRPLGEYPPPGTPLDRGDVRPLLLERAHYSTAVTSGNVFSRWALEAVMPVPEAPFRYCADGYLNTLVPFEGEVAAIDTPLAAYRVHDRNFSTASRGVDAQKFRSMVSHHLDLVGLIDGAAQRNGLRTGSNPLSRYAGHLESRLVSAKLEPSLHPIPGERPLRVAGQGIVATWRTAEMPPVRRVFDTVWFAAVAVTPSPVARKIVSWKYARGARPRVVQLMARGVRRLTG